MWLLDTFWYSETFFGDGYYYTIWFSGIDYFTILGYLGEILDTRSTNALYVYWLFLTVYTIIFSYVVRGILKIFGYKGFSFNNKEKYFHLCFMVIPIFSLVYGIIVGLSDLNIRKQVKYIVVGTIGWSCLIAHRMDIGAGFGGLISPFYFFPFFILGLLLYGTKKKNIILFKHILLFIIFFLLIAQPYFYRAFLDFKNPELGKICYARDVARYTNNNYVAGSQCFKVFEPFRFYPWMHEFGRTWEELSTKQK